MTELERYFAVGRAAGCPPEQMGNFERAGVILQERQLAASAAARLCDQPDGPSAIGYGGARGGGKTRWLLARIAVCGRTNFRTLPSQKMNCGKEKVKFWMLYQPLTSTRQTKGKEMVKLFDSALDKEGFQSQRRSG